MSTKYEFISIAGKITNTYAAQRFTWSWVLGFDLSHEEFKIFSKIILSAFLSLSLASQHYPPYRFVVWVILFFFKANRKLGIDFFTK